MWYNGRYLYDDYGDQDDFTDYQKSYGKAVKETKEKSIIAEETQVNNVKKILDQQFGDRNGVIYLEPLVDVKMKHMMAIAGDKEIFAKMSIVKEDGILVVKDLVIPHQVVTSASFTMDEDNSSKFMYSLAFKDNDITKERRTPDEITEYGITLNGHFHSHNCLGSKGKPSPSSTDTEDMMDQIKNRPYWVEIIGTLGGYSGRIIIKEPIEIITPIDVEIKWWSGIRDTLNETKEKLYTYNIKDTIKTDKKSNVNNKVINASKLTVCDCCNTFLSPDEIKGLKLNDGPTIFVCDKCRKDYGFNGSYELGLRNLTSNIVDKRNKIDKKVEIDKKDVSEITKDVIKNDFSKTELNILDENDPYYLFEWDRENPLMVDLDIVPKSIQESMASLMESVLNQDEKIMVELYIDNFVEIVIYDKTDEYVGMVFSRLEKEMPDRYKTWIDFCEARGFDEDLYSYNDGVRIERKVDTLTPHIQ